MVMKPTVRALLLGTAAVVHGSSVLAQDLIELAPIEVESKRDVATDTATSETTVDYEEIEDRQAGTIAELVDSVPGVNLVNGGSPVGSGINIRGFGANGTFGTDQKVGIQIGGASKGSEEIYRVGTQLFTDPALFREAVVLRGMGGTFEYGSGYFGGLIRLEPLQASDFTLGEPGLRLRQTLQFSSNGDGLTSSTIGAWQVNEDLEVLFNYVWREEGVTEDGAGNPRSDEGYELPSWLVNTRYTFGDARQHSIGLLLSRTQTDEKDVPYDSFGVTADSFGNVDRQTDDKTAVLRYRFDSPNTEWINLEVDLSYSDQQIDQEYVPGSSPLEGTSSFPLLVSTVNADHRYETTKLLIKNNAFFSTGNVQHDLRFGLDLSERERLDASSAPGGTDRRIALFAVDDIDLNDALTVTPQVRFESQEIGGDTYGFYDNTALMGGLSARYEFASGIAVFGGVFYGESMPIIDDLGTPLYMTQPEKAVTYELGVSYDSYDIFADGDALAVKAVVYQTRVWDITSYINLTDVEHEGLELEAAYSTMGGYYVDMNANIARSDNTTPGSTSYWEGTPADEIRLTLGRKWDRWLDVSWEVVADRGMDRSVTPSTGYGVHNLRATYRPESGFLEGTEFRVGIENLFDREYTPALATRTAMGRNLKFTVSKTF